MEKQLGKITYVNSEMFQNTMESDELQNALFEKKMINPGAFLSDVDAVFQSGSPNRSYFFLDMPFDQYASKSFGANSYYIPVYGVKGLTPGFKRAINYSEILVCSETNLEGNGFADTIFGTNYMMENESVTDHPSELVQVIERDKKQIAKNIPNERKADICMLLAKLWEVQEENPRTRLIIRLDHPETESMKLLKDMYLLLPQGLRLQLGFETNITDRDLQLIQEKNGLPVYILTAASDAEFDLKKIDFPVCIFDYASRSSYTYNQDYLNVLKAASANTDDLFTVLLDYHEKKVMDKEMVSYSSFKFYRDILSGVANGANYWWRNADVESLDALKAQYEDQRTLLNNEDLHKEAMYEFLTKILPESKLSGAIASLAFRSSDPKQQDLRDFLSDVMYQRVQIEAIDRTKQEADRLKDEEKAIALEKLTAEKEQEKAAAVSQAKKELYNEYNAKQQINAEKFNSIKAKRDEYKAQCEELERELDRSNLRGIQDNLDAATKKNKVLLIAVIVAAVLFLCSAGLAVFMGMGKSSAEKANSEAAATIDAANAQITELTTQNNDYAVKQTELQESNDLLNEEISQKEQEYDTLKEEYDQYMEENPASLSDGIDETGDTTADAYYEGAAATTEGADGNLGQPYSDTTGTENNTAEQ